MGGLPFAIRRADLFMFQRAPFCSLRNIYLWPISATISRARFHCGFDILGDGEYNLFGFLSFSFSLRSTVASLYVDFFVEV